ncbi:MAG: glutathione-disulfide reductase, partial [Betaproteobacteria bacterium]|nr:glutathione-disulfide reductase [Betaproteobacteria bacterium]
MFDLIVVGGGSGGVRAARIAAQYGASVALIESYRLGGTCVIRGCVPKKLMVYASRFASEFEAAKGFGWTVGENHFDWGLLKVNRDAEVARLEAIYRRNLENAGVVIHQGHARIIDQFTVAIDSATTLQGKTILIATGAQAVNDLSVQGYELCIDSNAFFEMERQPRRVLVHGAGYIALELASVFRHLGTEVQVVYRGEKVLRGFDDELRTHLESELRLTGLKLMPDTGISQIRKDSDSLRVELSNGDASEVDCVLKAIGRKPNTDGLGLETIGITLDRHGAIPVNTYSQTVIPNIYAVGDVTNRVNLTPMAIREGQAFADTVFGGKDIVVDHNLVPTAVFTTPEIGTVGLTEEQALARYPALDVYSTHFRTMKATLSGQPSKTFMKLLVDRASDRLLGFHALGPDTGEMVQLMGVALQMKVTKSALDATL